MDAVTEQELHALKAGYRAKSIKRVSAAHPGWLSALCALLTVAGENSLC
jgi:hypothetical protein